MPKITLKEFAGRVCSHVKSIYKPEGSVPSPILRPFAFLKLVKAGEKFRTAGKSQMTTKDYAGFWGKRAIQGPLLNILFLGVPIMIYVGRIMRSEKKDVPQQVYVPKKSKYGGQGVPPPPPHQPIVLRVPDVVNPVPQGRSEDYHSTKPKLQKSQHLPHMPHADVMQLKVYHGLLMAGMSDGNARGFAVGVFDEIDVIQLAVDGVLSEEDLAALAVWIEATT